jgi:hypothetical protein
LRRCHGIVPFSFYGGPVNPALRYPLFYEGVGPLVVEPPVVVVGGDAGSLDFGPATGALPYPKGYFAPYESAASSSGSGRP